VITSLTAKKRIDLIVMGTVGRTGIPGFLIGNTAETVLRQVNCSVLAVKPEGFVTPVKIEPIERSPS
jgi:nucleotide-binding universal stress UspA family protein